MDTEEFKARLLREVPLSFTAAHGHERLSAVVRREVVAWRDHLADARVGPGLAPSTVNARLATLPEFTT